ncbi:hypothetical protein B9E89_001110 [Salmonella enterica subsp. enterica serovar Norwich]|nr:hypothetical protein [Salmonella enterica]EDP8845885.1 hypothetical protein [Salmonella enterica subsp. enterica serovar Norwich]EDQ1181833.1 hypothetical protein [Salmonella enterica subsp. enterica serovar Norwich]EDR0137832.1 hypothetical protein [Salmonella enterica subsp. enterica serovar Norwich]EDR1791020.1 hypothetical protein [Salmonella enterica subsp. enterica serovar Norwich]
MFFKRLRTHQDIPKLKSGSLTGLELHLYLLLLLSLFSLAIFLPTYLPSLLFSYQ